MTTSSTYVEAPKTFMTTKVTLNVSGISVTKTVEEWCIERNLKPRCVYQRRKKFSSWEESFAKKPYPTNKRYSGWSIKK